jgi:ATP-dependent DNA helicase PIF1
VANFPTEFLNTLHVSGIPQHELKLKIGAIVILLKNINSSQGLCYGTRLFVEELRYDVILAIIAAGKHKGLKVFLSRITMSPADSLLTYLST